MIRLELSASVEESLILTLLDVANHLTRNGEAMAAREGLTTQQWQVMLQIAGDPNLPRSEPANGDGVLASEIASARGVSCANVSSMVSTLLRKRLIRQTDDPRDRRRKRLALTRKGRRAIEGLEPLRRRANLELFKETRAGTARGDAPSSATLLRQAGAGSLRGESRRLSRYRGRIVKRSISRRECRFEADRSRRR